MRRIKILELKKLSTKFMIIALQEVHGDDVAASLASSGILQSHILVTSHPFYPSGENRGDAGGVGFLLHKGFSVKGDDGSLIPLSSLTPASAQPFLSIDVPGRAISFQLFDASGIKNVTLLNVHNYELLAQGMTIMGKRIRNVVRLAKGDLTNSSVILLGDFNLQPTDEAKIKIDCPSTQGVFQNCTGPFYGRWKAIFDLFTEIKFPQPNHFVSESNFVNKLTRIFVFTCRSVLPLLEHQAGVVNDPIYYHGQGISDHAPTFWQFSLKSFSQQRDQRIQHSWCRHPAYAKRMDNLCKVAKLDELPVSHRSISVKAMIMEAATHARDCTLLEHPRGKHSRLLAVLLRLCRLPIISFTKCWFVFLIQPGST